MRATKRIRFSEDVSFIDFNQSRDSGEPDVEHDETSRSYLTEAQLISLRNQNLGGQPFTPISQLPPEILLLIFMIDATLPPTRHSIIISQVCHRWRTLSLNYAPLWSFIDTGYRTTHPELVAELFRRSQGSLIDLTVDRPDILRISCDHVAALRSIDIHISSDNLHGEDFSGMVKAFKVLTCLPAAQLRELSVSYFTRREHNAGLPVLLIPHPLFEGCSMHLRKLSLTRCLMTGPCYISLMSQHLRVLSLYRCGHFTFQYWIQILQNAPFLEHLCLRDMKVIATSMLVEHPTICLPNLIYLNICSTLRICSQFASHIMTHPSCDITMEFSTETPVTHLDVTELLGILKPQAKRIAKEREFIVDISPHHFDIQIGKRSLDVLHFDENIDIPEEGYVNLSAEGEEAARGIWWDGSLNLLASLSSEISWSGTYTLSLELPGLKRGVPPELERLQALADVLAGLEEVETLNEPALNLLFFLRTMSLPEDANLAIGSARLLLPSLQTIAFCSVLFWPGETHLQSNAQEQVLEFLGWRIEMGCGIRKIVLRDAHPMADKLEAVVQSFETLGIAVVLD